MQISAAALRKDAKKALPVDAQQAMNKAGRRAALCETEPGRASQRGPRGWFAEIDIDR